MKNARTYRVILILLSLFAVFGLIVGIMRLIDGDTANGLKACGLAAFGLACIIGCFLMLREKK